MRRPSQGVPARVPTALYDPTVEDSPPAFKPTTIAVEARHAASPSLEVRGLSGDSGNVRRMHIVYLEAQRKALLEAMAPILADPDSLRRASVWCAKVEDTIGGFSYMGGVAQLSIEKEAVLALYYMPVPRLRQA